MADLVITAASVLADSSARTAHGTAGAAITAGQVVYLDPDTDTYKLADSNVAAARSPAGIALHAAATGQPLTICEGGLINVGAALDDSVAYYLSDTPGGICPVADVGAGEYSVLLGMATTTALLRLKIQESGVAT
jgi:hypothetical protein